MACGTTIGSVIREARLAPWVNFRQRALNVAIAEIKRKTESNIILESLEQAEHGRVTALIFAIKTQAAPNENVPSKRMSNHNCSWSHR
jgi:hypothetical protein